MCEHTRHTTCAEAREQCCGPGSLFLPLWSFQAGNSGQTPGSLCALLPEPSHTPVSFTFSDFFHECGMSWWQIWVVVWTVARIRLHDKGQLRPTPRLRLCWLLGYKLPWTFIHALKMF